jgi:magnesium-transporting ATPase (P-type)
MTSQTEQIESGLSEQIAQSRLQQEGYNELTATGTQSILTLIIGVVKEPMLLLLVAAGLIYLFLGMLTKPDAYEFCGPDHRDHLVSGT